MQRGLNAKCTALEVLQTYLILSSWSANSSSLKPNWSTKLAVICWIWYSEKAWATEPKNSRQQRVQRHSTKLAENTASKKHSNHRKLTNSEKSSTARPSRQDLKQTVPRLLQALQTLLSSGLSFFHRELWHFPREPFVGFIILLERRVSLFVLICLFSPMPHKIYLASTDTPMHLKVLFPSSRPLFLRTRHTSHHLIFSRPSAPNSFNILPFLIRFLSIRWGKERYLPCQSSQRTWTKEYKLFSAHFALNEISDCHCVFTPRMKLPPKQAETCVFC